MIKRFKEIRPLALFVSLMMVFAVVIGSSGTAFARDDESTMEVYDLSTFAQAMTYGYVTHIIVTQDIDFNCMTSDLGYTARNILSRNLTIEGANPGITLRRVLDEDASASVNGEIQSLFGITGGGFGNTSKAVTFKNITLDGGADFGSYTGYDRVTHYDDILRLGGVCGRSLIDVYASGIVNLESGVTIQNCYCTDRMSTLNTDEVSSCYGGAIRIEYASKSEGYGGTVNMYDGVCIKNCVASSRYGDSYGGAIGAYCYGNVNIYGGTIENCSATYGGAVSCSYYYLNNYSTRNCGVFNMQDGLIRLCSAKSGGAFYAEGSNRSNKNNYLLGGTIEGCTARSDGNGPAVSLKAGSDNRYTKLYLNPYDEVEGPLFVRNCSGSTNYTDPTTTYNGKTLGYKWFYLSTANGTYIIINEPTSCKIRFKLNADDTDYYATYTISPGSSLGSSFPRNPGNGEYTFKEWNTSPTGNGTKVTSSTTFDQSTIVYAIWNRPETYTVSPESVDMTYGDSSNTLTVISSTSNYGSNIHYSWKKCDRNGNVTGDIAGATGRQYVIPYDTPAGTYYYKCYITNDNTSEGKYTPLVTVNVSKRPLTISWSDNEFVYDGNEKCPIPVVTQGYVSGHECGVEATGAQVNAGSNYVATAVLIGEDAANYTIGSGATVSFVIYKRSLNIVWTDKYFTYDGSEKAPTPDISGLSNLFDCRVIAAGAQVNAGTYQATAQLIGENIDNFVIANGASCQFSISKKPLTVSWSNTEFNYDGNTKTPKATLNGVVAGDNCTVQVSGGSKDAGNHTATAALAGSAKGNYSISGSGETSYTIHPKPVTLSWSNTTLVYNSENQKPSCSLTGVIAGDDCRAQVSGEKEVIGIYTASADLVGSAKSNYVISGSNQVSYEIVKKGVTVNWTNTVFEYDGNTKKPDATLSGVVSGDDCRVYVSGASSSVGVHTATAQLIGTHAGNYYISGGGSVDFTIASQVVTVNWTNTSFVYDGSVKTPKATLSDVPAGADLQVTVTGGAKNAGSHTAKAVLSGTDASNYVIAGSDETTFTISPKTVGLNWSNTSQVYNTSVIKPSAKVSGAVSGDTVRAEVSASNRAAGTYLATASLTGADAGNYVIAESDKTCSYTIEKAPVTITWSDTVFTYDGGVKKPVATVNGVYSVDSCRANVSAGQTDAGTYSATATLVGADIGNYIIQSGAACTYTINAKPVTINWTKTSFVYDGTVKTPEAELTGLIDGDDCYLTVSGGKKAAGTYTATAAVNGSDKANYIISGSNTTTFTVSKKTVNITWTGNSFEYDGSIKTPTASLSGVVTGDDCRVSVSGGASSIGTHIATASLTGNTKSNYVIATGNETFTFVIVKYTISIVWSNTEFTYDGNEKIPTATLVGVKENDDCRVEVTGAGKTAGTHTATATLVGRDKDNYAVSGSYEQSFVIKPKTVTVKWSNTVFDYDGKAHKPDASLTGVLANDDCKVNVSAAKTDAGSYNATASLTGSDASNYVISGDDHTSFTINAKPVTINWTKTSFVYDGTVKTPEAELTGLIDGDDCYLTVSGGKKAAGTYTATAAVNGSDKANYIISGSNTTTFTVSKKTVNITWTGNSFEYDGSIKTPTASLSGVVTGDDCRVSVSGGASSIGTHIATASLTGNTKSNYVIATGNETFTFVIVKYTISIVWSNTEFTYDGNEKIPTATLVGVKENDDCRVEVTGASKTAGTHTATATLVGRDKENYAISGDFEKSFVIKPKKVTVKWTATAFEYNGNTRTPSASLTGVVSGDNCYASVTGGQSAVGTYTARAALAGSAKGNYVISGSNETSFEITKKTLTLTWSEKTFDYDGSEKTPKATLSGVVSGDECRVGVKGGKSAAGTYTATAFLTGSDKDNYQLLSNLTTSFTIKPLTVTLRWGLTNLPYNGAELHPIAMVEGVINGDNCVAAYSGSAKDAGTHTATGSLTGADAGNYVLDPDTATCSFVIVKKKVNISWSNTEYVFDGIKKTPTATVSGIYSGDNVTLNITGESRYAGKHTAYAFLEGTDSGNYMIADGEDNCSFTINKRPVNIVWLETELAYNGQYQSPSATVDVNYSGDNLKVLVNAWAMNVGTYTATASLTGNDSGNYYIASGSRTSFSIKSAVTIEWSDLDFVYDGQIKTPKAVITGGLSTGDDCSIVVEGGQTAAGEHTATAVLTGENAHLYAIAGDKTISYTISPKEVSLVWSDTDLTYNGKKQAPKASVSDLITGDDCTAMVEGGQTAAGTYTATALLTGEDAGNYVIAAGSGTASFTIKEPESKPSVTTAPAVSLTIDKKNLSIVCGNSATLKATLKGSSSKISWKSSDSKVATVDANGKISAKMAGEVTVTATAAGKTAKCVVTVLYKDVTNMSDFWYAPTNYLTAKGVVKGYANQTEFRPANDCTRAQMITFLYRLQGEPKTKSTTCKFTDVKSTEYFYKPVIWAVEQGITTVPSDKKFNPQTVCTRAMTVTFLWRMAGKPEPKTTKNPFPDVEKTDYFYKATLWASEMKILAGLPDGTFQPQGKCLRRQMVTFLYKYDKYVNGKG